MTDDERREAARRLRELRVTASGVTSVGHGYLWSLLWAVSGEELGESNRCDWFERMCSHLAELIEPSCDRNALLALADEMTVEKGDIWRWSSRIREALGMES